jgi:hypothetical protein
MLPASYAAARSPSRFVLLAGALAIAGCSADGPASPDSMGTVRGPESVAGSGNAGAPAGTSTMADDPASAATGTTAQPSSTACQVALPRVQEVEPDRAEHGRALLQDIALTPGVLPELVIRNLWVAWGAPPPPTDADFWAELRRRYGLIEAPFDNAGLPLGMRREGAGVAFDCMLCHGGRIAGITLLGAPNSGIDLESLYDDLLIMRDLAPMLGIPAPPVPYDLDGLTQAAGAQDAFGLGFRFAGPIAGGVNTRYGPQRAPAWWQLQYKERIYADGSGAASGHRSFMATLVAFGITPDQLVAREQDFVDIAHYVRSMQAPCWSFTTLDEEKRARGRQVFSATCARCHGVYEGAEAQYPNLVVPLEEVGTDPVRAQRFGSDEALVLNGSWFGDPPLSSTGGYLAPPLVGIWARAPYFHNGSVPDLIGVLDPSKRPARWRRLGSELEHYDVERVGLRYDEVSTPGDPDTREGRLVYDTTREGMGNGGHPFGAPLSEADRSDLLEYLRGL